MGGFPPPGQFGRIQPTPESKGLQPGQGDPLPGSTSHRDRDGAKGNWFTRLFRRRGSGRR